MGGPWWGIIAPPPSLWICWFRKEKRSSRQFISIWSPGFENLTTALNKELVPKDKCILHIRFHWNLNVRRLIWNSEFRMYFSILFHFPLGLLIGSKAAHHMSSRKTRSQLFRVSCLFIWYFFSKTIRSIKELSSENSEFVKICGEHYIELL